MFFVIPFFRTTSYLKETLQSLVAQTDPNWQAVVLDDSIDLYETEAAKNCVEHLGDSRLQYLKNLKNLGMAKNWNQGLDIAAARNFELVVILHADDRLKNDYAFEMKALADRYPNSSAYFCRTEIIGSNGSSSFSFADAYKNFLLPRQSEIVLSGIDGIKKLIPGNFIFCPSLCYRLSKIQAERFREDKKMVLDFEFILLLLERNQSLTGFYRRPLFEYRRHTENATVGLTKNLTRFHEEISLYLNLSERMKTRDLAISIQAKKMRVIKLNLMFQILKSLLGFQWRSSILETKLLLELL